MELKTTPLIEEHKKLQAKCAPFGGWLMPIQYSGIIEEHNWTRSRCTVFDICHMGEFLIDSVVRDGNLDKVLTCNLSEMPLKTCRYGFMLDASGGIIDDVIIYRLAEAKWMLVVNAATTDGDEAHLRAHLSENEQLVNVSADLAKLDLQGPLSTDVLSKIAGPRVAELKYYAFDHFPVLGESMLISRTGYTGELGYELYIKKEKSAALWNAILNDPEVKPAGLGARDTLRLEVCYPLYGQDIGSNTNPLEAGLAGFVDFGKDFIGKPALLRRKEQGVARKLVCFKTNTRRAPRHDFKIFKEENEIGEVTSGSFAPSLCCGIGMGYVKEGCSAPGTMISLRQGNTVIEAVIEKKPFYKKGTAKGK